MTKYTSQMNFVSEQLDASGYHWTGTHNFRVRRAVEDVFRVLDTKGLTEDEAQEALRIIYMLGSSLSLAPEGNTISRNMNWTTLTEGESPVGTMCRIKLNAYEGAKEGLNGKVGSISGFTANGQVRVYLRTFASSVTVPSSDLEVIRKMRF